MEDFYYSCIYDLLETDSAGKVDIATINHFKAKIVNIHAQRACASLIGEEVDMLLKGEQPTLYQAVKKHSRRASGIIQAIWNEDGERQETPAGIAATIVTYLRQYAPIAVDEGSMDTLLSGIDTGLTTGLNLDLLVPFTAEEVHRARKAGGANRAPGLDRLGIGFYRATWELIRGEVLQLCNAMFYERQMSSQQKHGIVVCVPKQKTALPMVSRLCSSGRACVVRGS
jgi:hypothetical protein